MRGGNASGTFSIPCKPTSTVRSHSCPSRSEMLNHKLQVHRLMEGFGFEAGNQEKEINLKGDR